jgi:hypothetical protein
MDWLTVAIMLAYGGSFGDNFGVEANAWANDHVGASVGVGFTKYATAKAGPSFRVGVGEGWLTLGAEYAFDYDRAGDASIGSHSALLSVGFMAPVSERVYVEPELVPVRYPFDVNTTIDGETRDVPIDPTDASVLVPGVGVGFIAHP